MVKYSYILHDKGDVFMPLVPAICTQCGANIEVDDSHEASICKYCGTAFITEKAINNYTTNYTTNITNNTNIDANVVNIYHTEKDFVIKAGKLIEYNGESDNVIIPTNVNTIGTNAFSKANWENNEVVGCSIKRIIIPSSVKKIEEEAFYNCQDLTTIIMTNETSQIGSSCFLGCVHLTTMAIVDNTENITDFSNIQEGIVQLPANLRKIPSLLFNKCESITTVIIPNGVTSIESFSFMEMSKLREITIPDSVVNVSAEAFHTPLFDEDTIKIVYASESWKKQHGGKISCLSAHFISSANKRATSNQTLNNGCYIATCVYGSYDCPQVWTLRRFRDYTLDATWYGRAFIKCYYAISPTMIKWFGNQKWFRSFWKKKLDKMVSKLNSNGVEGTQYTDKY